MLTKGRERDVLGAGKWQKKREQGSLSVQTEKEKPYYAFQFKM